MSNHTNVCLPQKFTKENTQPHQLGTPQMFISVKWLKRDEVSHFTADNALWAMKDFAGFFLVPLSTMGRSIVLFQCSKDSHHRELSNRFYRLIQPQGKAIHVQLWIIQESNTKQAKHPWQRNIHTEVSCYEVTISVFKAQQKENTTKRE